MTMMVKGTRSTVTVWPIASLGSMTLPGSCS
jgi:hypothetical protein